MLLLAKYFKGSTFFYELVASVQPHPSTPVLPAVHRPRSPRQNNMGGASPGPASVAAAQAGAAPMEASAPPPVASSPAAATPTPGTGAGPAAEGETLALPPLLPFSPSLLV
jgi:hypothetical protein